METGLQYVLVLGVSSAVNARQWVDGHVGVHVKRRIVACVLLVPTAPSVQAGSVQCQRGIRTIHGDGPRKGLENDLRPHIEVDTEDADDGCTPCTRQPIGIRGGVDWW